MIIFPVLSFQWLEQVQGEFAPTILFPAFKGISHMTRQVIPINEDWSAQ
ncbi:MAG: hypothetical protein NVS4B7_20830 [Ktedonobacteraceae bacterium]